MKNILRAIAVAIFLAGITVPIHADTTKPSNTPTTKTQKQKKHHHAKKMVKGKATPTSK